MTLALLVYLASLIGSLLVFFCAASILSFIMTFISMISIAESHSVSEEKVWQKRRNISFWVGMICVVFAMLVPTQKTMYMMAGAYAAQKVYESPEAAQISSKIVVIINNKLDEYLTEEVKKVQVTK